MIVLHVLTSMITVDQCVFCSYDPQHAYANCSWCQMLFSDVFVSQSASL